MKLALAVLGFWLWSSASIAGPGGSIGNARSTINGLGKGYFFQSPYPTDVTITPQKDHYDFGLAGYVSDVTVEPYDPKVCARGTGYKTVCVHESVDLVALYIVFSDLKVYVIRLHNRGVGLSGLKSIGQDLAFGFTRNHE